MNDWNLENFAKFWEDIEYAFAMAWKSSLYYGEYGPPWENDDNDQDGDFYDDDDDYESWMDYL